MLKKVRANTNGNSFTSISEITKTIIAQGSQAMGGATKLNGLEQEKMGKYPNSQRKERTKGTNLTPVS